MRLIVHAGLHKTGSTYLQHIMNDHHDALLARGVYYEKQPGYPAHHFAAWDVLRRDFSPILAMVQAARDQGCETVIFSSEDLEAVIFDRISAEGIERAAAIAGVDAVEWHFCLRDPGEYFSSLYAQLQHHIYTDPAAMLFEILREGMMLVMDPLAGQGGTPFWGFCFDHLRYLSAFAAETPHPVYAHDFRDSSPFPGWPILHSAGVLDAISVLPGAAARNARLDPGEVEAGYCDRILRLLPDKERRAQLRPVVTEQVRRSAEPLAAFSALVGETFGAGTASALKLFAYPPGRAELRACA